MDLFSFYWKGTHTHTHIHKYIQREKLLPSTGSSLKSHDGQSENRPKAGARNSVWISHVDNRHPDT